jgi:hypothetical protein
MNTTKRSVPTVTLHYCGGTGNSIGKRFNVGLPALIANSLGGDAPITQIGYETNPEDITADIPYTVHLLGEVAGSGKVRATNAPSIMNFIKALETDALSIGDVNIVISALTGGTGAVAAYTLVTELKRRSPASAVIYLGVNDSSSHLDIENAIKQFQSFKGFIESAKAYLPTIMFDNRASRHAVDSAVTETLELLMTFLQAPTLEIDRTDRVNTFRADATIKALPGMHPILIHTPYEEGSPYTKVGATYVRNGVVYAPVIGRDIHTIDVIAKILTTDGSEVMPYDADVNVIARVAYPGSFVSRDQKPITLTIDGNDLAYKQLIADLTNAQTLFNSPKAVSSVMGQIGNAGTPGDVVL